MGVKGWRVDSSRRVYTLHPGEVVCADRHERLETLLGSCVAVILTDPHRTIGAMCHIVYSKPAVSEPEASSAYADAAIDSMYELLCGHGFNPRMCQAYLYGGGNMFPHQVATQHVGDANGCWVVNRLTRDGVAIVVKDLGGNHYRRLAWTVGTGEPEVTAVSLRD